MVGNVVELVASVVNHLGDCDLEHLVLVDGVGQLLVLGLGSSHTSITDSGTQALS